MQAGGFYTYTDGYSVQLTYKLANSAADGLHAFCLASPTKSALSCCGYNVASNLITGAAESYYVTSGVDKSTLDLSGESEMTALTSAETWKQGWNKYWKISYVDDGSNNFDITCQRFLPKLTDNASPAGDFRFSPNSSDNPD